MALHTKTVILMDHSQHLKEASGIQIEIDIGMMGGSRLRGGRKPEEEGFGRGHNWNYIPNFFPPVMKTLWTCAVENVIEYARIVYDVFADERLLRILLCQSTQGQTLWLNTWESVPTNYSGKQVGNVNQQSIPYITEAFANAGQPPSQKKQSFVGSAAGLQTGIKAAIDGLSQPSPSQIALMTSAAASGKGTVKPINRGRVVCITSCTTESIGQFTAEDLEDFLVTAVASQNRIANASDHLLPIVECELVLLSLHPLGKENTSRVLSRPLHDISNSVRAEVYVVTPDKLNEKILDICTSHHNLIVSTVTNIPMKEEQNAVSSSNYDVPFFHARMPSSSSETRMLRWSTPTAAKNGSGLCPGGVIQHCASATRITPVDVNSRPSTCLSNFVVNGRSVWLELPSRKGKQATHVLTPHGAEMWMHVMESRNTLEDLPAISEGVGGRITDYRINDFAEFIKSNILIPYPPGYSEHLPKPKYEKDGGSFVRRRSSSIDDGKKPVDVAKARLLRKTNYWPLTISGSVLFSLTAHIDKLLTLVQNETLSEMDKVECDKMIWNLMSLEARGDSAPPVPASHFRKGMKRDDQWKMVYGELETFIRANLHSETHKKVLECLLDCRSTDKSTTVSDPRIQDSGNGDKGSRGGKEINAEAALEEIKLLTSTPKSPVTDSPMSPPMSGSTTDVLDTNKVCRPNLLTLWMQKTEKRDLRTLTGGKLYPHLASSSNDQEGTGKSSRKNEA
ncbi:Protein asunder [Orchesella cincta]|uniref:Protein asunder n=1 Tax=Orchesella cincta TaxID=48709 RepID=A0A1D2N2F4_ORCCI|nr:Protein asunder [Orchesella cincta]